MRLPFMMIGLVLFSGGYRAADVQDAQVIWSDEFDGPAIDSSTWTYDVGGHGFGNGQLEFNTARPENSAIENGNLVITARREDYSGNAFTSARMMTQGRFAFQYGTLEARIRVPNTADGLWPAFWMLGNNFPAIGWPGCGEIDILEIGGKEGIAQGLQRRRINCALHFSDAAGKYAMHDAWWNADVDLDADYHVYRVSWTPQDVTFFVDDVQFASWDITADHLREFRQPCFLILNLAVGSRKSSYTGLDRPDVITAKFPARMYVDWIRVTKNPHTKVYLATDREERGNLGVYTETVRATKSLRFADPTDPEFAYGDAAALYEWNNMAESTSRVTASEGSECWSFDVAAGEWFGMGVFLPSFRNMKNYSDGTLHFDIKTDSPVPMKVGIKSSRGGESFLALGDETAEFGFARDGQWHQLAIPLDRFTKVDFLTVHQVFMIAGEAPPSATGISIDNVWWQPGPSPQSDATPSR